jgi:hypothetical protein
MISVREGQNVRRAFDGMRVMLQNGPRNISSMARKKKCHCSAYEMAIYNSRRSGKIEKTLPDIIKMTEYQYPVSYEQISCYACF